MSDVKNTTSARALEIAIAKLQEEAELAKSRIDHAIERAIADLKTHEGAVAQVSGLVERAKHAYVKDFAVPNIHGQIALGGTALRLTTGQDVNIIENAPWGARESSSYPALEQGKTYRFWLLIEEVGDDRAG